MIEEFGHRWWGPDFLSMVLDQFDWNNPVTVSDGWETQLAPGFIAMCVILSEYARDSLFRSQWKSSLAIFEDIIDNGPPDSINAIWRKWVADVWVLADIAAKRKRGILIRRDLDQARLVIQNEAIIAAIEDSLGSCDVGTEE